MIINFQNRVDMANDIIENVQTKFLASPLSSDRASFKSFSSPEEMIDDLRKRTLRVRGSSRSARLIEMIGGFSKKLQSYFEIIGVLSRRLW